MNVIVELDIFVKCLAHLKEFRKENSSLNLSKKESIGIPLFTFKDRLGGIKRLDQFVCTR